VHERGPDGLVVVALPGSYHATVGLTISRDGQTFDPWAPHIAEGGRWALRFRVPPLDWTTGVSEALLLLRGVGARSVSIQAHGATRSQTRLLTTHSYRDNLISLRDIGVGPGDEVTVTVDRNETEYVAEQMSRSHERVLVDLDAPLVFAPSTLRIERP
jgi:hypothetical protein